jgi:hypothetical protein
MKNIYFFIIILIGIITIYYIHISSENFKNMKNEKFTINNNIFEYNSNEKCKKLNIKKFMIRDLRTKLWLSFGLEEGFNKFLPGRFGIPLIMSDKPDDYLPLRPVSKPNNYLASNFEGNGIKIIINNETNLEINNLNKIFIIQVYIYKGYNVIGYINESNIQLYLYIDDNGYITSTFEPINASIIEIINL